MASVQGPSKGTGTTAVASEASARVDDVVEAVGPKIRDLRQSLGLSLQQLAGLSGVSAAAIHKVERSDMVPTITTLLKLATALGRPVSYFIDESPEALGVATHIRRDQRPAINTGISGLALSAISGPSSRFRIQAAIGSIEPHTTNAAPARTRGEQLLVVLDGVLVVEVQGHVYTVEEGGALHFPTDRPRKWTNPGPRRTRVLWVSLPEVVRN